MNELNDCGCCEGLNAETPVLVYNRPGLKAIRNRVGTHARFKESMLASLSASTRNALQNLNTREDDDFSIALLDSWALVADILTFYQERIANESYLRTATERVSILHLARLIGYELRPGVAASTYLAFTADDPTRMAATGTALATTPGTPTEIAIAKGTKVQSIPGQDEQAQIFETIEEIKARPEWNGIKPRLTKPHLLNKDLESLTVHGLSTTLKIGDSVLIVTGTDRTVKRVLRIVSDSETGTTRLDLVAKPLPQKLTPRTTNPGQFAYVKSALTNNYIMTALIDGASWKQEDLLAMATIQNWSPVALQVSINSQVPKAPPATDGVFAFRVHATLFGHNAPRWDSLPANQRYGEWILDRNDGTFGYTFIEPVYPTPGWEGRTLATDANGTNYLYLDNTYSGIIKDSWIVLENPRGARVAYLVKDYAEVTRCDFAISAKVSRLELYDTTGFEEFKLRETTVYARSEQLELAPTPITDPVEGSSITLDGAYLGLKTGQTVVVSGEPADLKGTSASEIVELSDVSLVEGYTRLSFKGELTHKYLCSTVRVNANLAAATHGETREEIVGSGDATQSFQSFVLRQPPLTHVSAATPSGAESTLEVRVNEVLWHEVSTLYEHGPTERIYATRTDDEGVTTVMFGDGTTGARLPTGVENVRATYRKGIGTEGLVKAGQLSLLMTRPLGVREVINPLDADGADDSESRDDARSNAPLNMLTLDRIVSLTDYGDFARAYSGIAKALATWTWDGERRSVFVTVAGPDGAEIGTNSILYENLLKSMKAAGDPSTPLQVKSYRPALFKLAATVKIDSDYQSDTVLDAVKKVLRSHFSFGERAFGQPVTLSEVIAVIQAVEGVIAVNVTKLYHSGTIPGPGATPPRHLIAAMPEAGTDATLAAELLTLDPCPLAELGVSA